MIYKLVDDNGTDVEETELKKHITKYYKSLFGKLDQNTVELEELFTHDIPQVTNSENEILTASFTVEEVHKAVFQMEHNKAPGTDGFPVEFYQVFWELTKEDLMAMLSDFHDNILSAYSLNLV